jgi:hypothetical protein
MTEVEDLSKDTLFIVLWCAPDERTHVFAIPSVARPADAITEAIAMLPEQRPDIAAQHGSHRAHAYPAKAKPTTHNNHQTGEDRYAFLMMVEMEGETGTFSELTFCTDLSELDALGNAFARRCVQSPDWVGGTVAEVSMLPLGTPTFYVMVTAGNTPAQA